MASNPVKLFGRRCRNVLIWVIAPAHFGLYQRFSKLCHEIHLDYTDQVEPFGLDERWLDLPAINEDRFTTPTALPFCWP